MMLNRLLRKKHLRLPLDTRLERRANQVVKQKRAVHQQCETRNLDPLKRLPSESERHDPDEQCAASINRRARSSRHGARDRKTEEVEATVSG
jgi:hypothetical protein